MHTYRQSFTGSRPYEHRARETDRNRKTERHIDRDKGRDRESKRDTATCKDIRETRQPNKIAYTVLCSYKFKSRLPDSPPRSIPVAAFDASSNRPGNKFQPRQNPHRSWRQWKQRTK